MLGRVRNPDHGRKPLAIFGGDEKIVCNLGVQETVETEDKHLLLRGCLTWPGAPLDATALTAGWRQNGGT